MEGFEWLINLDRAALVIIHNDSDHAILDNVFLLIRNALTWIPLYVFVLFFAVTKFNKKIWLFIGLSLLTFAICDQLTASVLKPLFQRPRPCFDEALQPYLRNIIECGGRYSFPSSHAANHFGLAGFWYWSVERVTGQKWKWLWIWAALICYAQVYVAKHYMLDVAAGAAIGVCIGALLSLFFNNLSDNLNIERRFSRFFQPGKISWR